MDYLIRCVAQGLRVIPVPKCAKAPRLRNWNELRLEAADLSTYFPTGDENVGLLLGDVSGGVVDVDIDSDVLLPIADLFLPQTATFGRTSRPRSHRLYVSHPPETRTTFKDPNQKMLVEVRANGHQTVIPFSTHPSGDKIEWSDGSKFLPALTTIDATDLNRRVGRLAAAALLGTHWPEKGGRQDLALAVAGALLASGSSDDEARTFIEAVTIVAKDDECAQRQSAVASTRKRLDAGEPVVGTPTLFGLIPSNTHASLSDWLQLGHVKASGTPDGDDPVPAKKPVERLVALLEAAAAVAVPSKEGEAFLLVEPRKGARSALRLRSQAAVSYLRSLYYRSYRQPISELALNEVVELLIAQALYSGRAQEDISLRYALDESTVWIDLGDDEYRIVRVDKSGYALDVPKNVLFRRTTIMAALPPPESGGAIDDLRGFVNLQDDEAWQLFLVWLVAAMITDRPFAILVLQGEAGSAKSTTSRIARMLVDPSTVGLFAPPRSESDLMVAARTTAMLALDNLSTPREGLADSLCRIATGIGLPARQLYTDGEMHVLSARRPILINGIDELLGRTDLGDRAILLRLSPIEASKRRGEDELLREFRAVQPRILGALYGLLSRVLAVLPDVTAEKHPLPRMVDYARVGIAVERALAWPTGSFLSAYWANATNIREDTVATDPVAHAVTMLVDEFNGRWQGTPTSLLTHVERITSDGVRRSSSWPRNAQSLSSHLTRVAPALRAQGVLVEKAKSGARTITLSRATEPAPKQATPFTPPQWRRGSSEPDTTTNSTTRGDTVSGDSAAWKRDSPTQERANGQTSLGWSAEEFERLVGGIDEGS
ncbi:MAG: bifunctional DNA primase/polymerase [Sandaracinaceae bacterium]|nr:bifunctional DNA primase/polymerase [Sandaracinaceae bacterium]